MATSKKKAPANSLQDLARVISGDVAPSVDAAALLRGIIKYLGGAEAAARIFAGALKAAEPGSQNQTRLLDTLQRLIIMNTQHDLNKRVEPSRMTTEDLMRSAGDIFRKYGHFDGNGNPGTNTEKGT